MDEITAAIVIAAVPFYTMGVIAVAYALAFATHMLRRLDQSATETATTETIPK
jgi:hypothetical protein